MSKIKFLLERSYDTLRSDGPGVLIKKICYYLTRSKPSVNMESMQEKTFADVLFINGCALPHPARYRIDHQREQLIANGINSSVIFYEEITEVLAKRYRVFIFFRCPITTEVQKLIKLAKIFNKIVLFDVDDLVIDTVYTDEIKYIKEMSKKNRALYSSGVERMRGTLELCDGAITTTPTLKEELGKYTKEVFLNRNVASEEMVCISQDFLRKKEMHPDMLGKNKAGRGCNQVLSIGYFSGSVTHNDDFESISSAVSEIMEAYQEIRLVIVGELNIPEALDSFKTRITALPFMDWRELPEQIGLVDINMIPLEDTLFNCAKSENKWVEASLVKTVTVASNVGAFKEMIEDRQTGLLCDNVEEWISALKFLIDNPGERERIANNAYHFVMKNCISIYTGFPLANYLRKKMTPLAAFLLPSTNISGGVMVALEHCLIIKEKGWDILIISESFEEDDIYFFGNRIPVLARRHNGIHGSIEKCVATLWSTTTFLQLYPNIKEKYYLVQGFETDFSKHGDASKILANSTYNIYSEVNYITISCWCKEWLQERFGKSAMAAPNGIRSEKFKPHKREIKKEVRILIEGNCDDDNKNVDESFRIVERMDEVGLDIFVSYLSYQGKAKEWYHVDRFFHKVPYEMVSGIYADNDILIKSSRLESFSYPPLEMMASGGYVLVSLNEGNQEYLVDNINCLTYPNGDVDGAVNRVLELISSTELQDSLYLGGLKTAKNRDWGNVCGEVLKLYGIE